MAAVQQLLASYGAAAVAGWSTLYSENCDGVTAPAIPSALSNNNAVKTTTSNPNTSPNSITHDFSGFDSDGRALFTLKDGNSGEARMSANVRMPTNANCSVQIAVRIAAVAAKADSTQGAYWISVTGNGSGTYACIVQKIVVGNGFTNDLSSTFTLAATTYYKFTIEARGTTVQAKCQRLSDNNFLQTNNTFSASEVYFYSGTDSSVTGNGYLGVFIFNSAGTTTVDDFLAEKYS